MAFTRLRAPFLLSLVPLASPPGNSHKFRYPSFPLAIDQYPLPFVTPFFIVTVDFKRLRYHNPSPFIFVFFYQSCSSFFHVVIFFLLSLPRKNLFAPFFSLYRPGTATPQFQHFLLADDPNPLPFLVTSNTGEPILPLHRFLSVPSLRSGSSERNFFC